LPRESKSDLRKSDFLIIRSKTDGSIVKIVSPQHFQVGFDDADFERVVLVNGTVKSTMGVYSPAFSGSLQTLMDGTSYLREGNNVSITSGSDGSITIAAGTAGIAHSLTGGGASKGIKAFDYDGTSAKEVEVDLDTINGGLGFSKWGLAVIPSKANSILDSEDLSQSDLLVIEDVTDADEGVKKITVGDLMSAATTGVLSNAITFGNGIYDSANAAASYNNSAAATIAVDLQTDPGLSFSQQKLGVLLNGATISNGASGLSVASVPSAVTWGVGLLSTVGNSFDGSAATTVSIDTGIIPALGTPNTFTGVNTFSSLAGGGIIGSIQEVSPGTDYLVGGSNVTITKDLPGAGQITIAASMGTGGDLTQGSGIQTFLYNGTAPATVALDATSLAVSGDRTSYVFLSDGGTTITKRTVATLVDLADRTALVASKVGGGITVEFPGSTVPAQFSIDSDGTTLRVGSSGLEVKKVPYNLTQTTGIATFSFNGSSAQTVGIDTGVVPRKGVDNTWTGQNTFGVSTTAGLTGSLQEVTAGVPYLATGTGMSITTSSNGQVVISTNGEEVTGITAGDGLSGTRTGGDVTLAVDLAPHPGLEFSTGKLKVDLDGNTLSLGISGISVASLPSALSQDVGINTFSFDGSTARTVGIDTAIVPRKNVDNTWSGKNTFGVSATAGLTGSLQEVTNGVPYLLASAGVTITTASNGQITISATGTGGTITGLTAGDGLSGGGSSGNVTVDIDLATDPGLQFTTGKLDAKLNPNDTIRKDADGLAVNKVPYDLTQGAGISSFGFDGSSGGQVVSIDQTQVPMLANDNTWTGDNIFSVGLSGSLQMLSDGNTKYMAGIGGIKISTSSLGQILVSGSEGKIYTAGLGLDLATDQFSVDNAIVATLTGSQFSGDVGITGSLGVEANAIFKTGLSGSLQMLSDGTTEYLAGIGGIAITTASNGQITISGSVGRVYTSGVGLSLEEDQFFVDNSIVATLTGSVFSGDLIAQTGLSGSLQMLSDGTTKYLAAGSGITILTASNGQVTIATTGVSGLSSVSQAGGSSFSDITAVVFTGSLVTEPTSGTAQITPVIGAPEDGDYTDGLFTDFSYGTNIGTAIDRFNEVLKGLAPPAAPILDDMNCSDSGATANLSFGSSQSISGYTNAQPSTLTPSSGLSDTNINGTYNSDTASNDLQVACFQSTIINGTLNADIPADGVNYSADSFGNADQGTLKLYVNDNVTPVHSVDLSTFGSGNSLNGNGTGFNLTAKTAGHFADGSNFETFQHRQGTYTIAAGVEISDDQRNGWNWARVVHTISDVDTTCNYVEWVNDTTDNVTYPLSSTGASFGALSMTGTEYLSGVKYYTGGSATYSVTVDNAYRNVYSNSFITFNGTNCGNETQAFDPIDWSGGENESKQMSLSQLMTINVSSILDGPISTSVTVPHPLRANLSSASSQSHNNILLYNRSDNSTDTYESFRGESRRVKSGSYVDQAAVTAGGNVWVSTTALTTVDGLMFYDQKLVGPDEGANGSDFSSVANGPAGNVDYSGITSGLRTFYRWFRNPTAGSDRTGFDLEINGAGTIVTQPTALTGNRIHVLCKLPTGSAGETGWMDLAIGFSTGQTSDGDGCYSGAFDSSLSATNTATFGTQTVAAGEYVMVKVEADASWTGNISSMTVAWS